jgi:hypothetical protein
MASHPQIAATKFALSFHESVFVTNTAAFMALGSSQNILTEIKWVLTRQAVINSKCHLEARLMRLAVRRNFQSQ